MGKRRGGNTRLARGTGTTVPKRKSWEAFDALPRAVREVMWAAPIAINPLDVASFVTAFGERRTCTMLRDAIDQELLRFATEHQQRHGVALPHMAAGVSLQGYGVLGTTRHPSAAWRPLRLRPSRRGNSIIPTITIPRL